MSYDVKRIRFKFDGLVHDAEYTHRHPGTKPYVTFRCDNQRTDAFTHAGIMDDNEPVTCLGCITRGPW